MILLMTVRFPPHKGLEVGEAFFKSAAGPLPPVFKKWQTYALQDLKGSKVYHLIFTEKDKGDEAMDEINKMFAPFMIIQGFKAKVEILMGMKDVAKMMKLAK